MKIVDAQIHIWADGQPTGLHRKVRAFTAEEALREMDEAGVDAALIYPPVSWDAGANAYAVEAARRYPDRFAVLGQFPPRDPTQRHLIQGWTRQPGTLVTSFDQQTDLAGLQEKLDELKESLLEYDVALEVRVNEKLHDREVRLANGWTVKIGRGLDFYQKPEGWFTVGATDLSLRRCLETKVAVFRTSSAAT